MVPTHPLTRILGALLASASLLLGACGDDDGDRAAFCEAMVELRELDPFQDLDIASPEDMRDAFQTLAEDADRIASLAPPDARPQARRYESAIDELVDELSGAGYDPRRLDALRYGQATEEYTDAAVSLDNAAQGACS